MQGSYYEDDVPSSSTRPTRNCCMSRRNVDPSVTVEVHGQLRAWVQSKGFDPGYRYVDDVASILEVELTSG